MQPEQQTAGRKRVDPAFKKVVITFSVNPELARRLREEVRYGRTLSRVIEDAVRKYLDE